MAVLRLEALVSTVNSVHSSEGAFGVHPTSEPDLDPGPRFAPGPSASWGAVFPFWSADDCYIAFFAEQGSQDRREAGPKRRRTPRRPSATKARSLSKLYRLLLRD